MKEVIEIEVVLLPRSSRAYIYYEKDISKMPLVVKINVFICLEVITLCAHMNINLHIVISIYE